ncbi:glutathione peroxidase 6, partial [human gut metagenome]
KECRLSLGYGLGSTHYWYWDPKTNMFMHSRDWDFEPYTASQVVKWYGEGKWKIEQ